MVLAWTINVHHFVSWSVGMAPSYNYRGGEYGRPSVWEDVGECLRSESVHWKTGDSIAVYPIALRSCSGCVGNAVSDRATLRRDVSRPDGEPPVGSMVGGCVLVPTEPGVDVLTGVARTVFLDDPALDPDRDSIVYPTPTNLGPPCPSSGLTVPFVSSTCLLACSAPRHPSPLTHSSWHY